jgi:hypothetical protein
MTYRATVSCDQPDCVTAIRGTAAGIDFKLHTAGWTSEPSSGVWFHTCPNHKPDVLSVEHRMLAVAGARILAMLKDLDDRGYYVTGHPADSGGALLHVHPWDRDGDADWPFVSVEQCGRSFVARLLTGDKAGTVVLDEDAEEWDV